YALFVCFFFQAEDGIRDRNVTGVQTCALPIFWMLVGFYRAVPIEMEEAASVDGAGKLRIFLRISTPIVAPGIAATAVYTFINCFNEFLYALLFISSTEKMPVAVALYSITGAEVLDWGAMMAASALVVV